MAQQQVSTNRRVVFHFDLNHTIIMSDRSKGLVITDSICRIVAKSAWGKLSRQEVVTGNETQTETHWVLAHDQLTFSQPDNPSMLANIPEGETAENIVTYMDYLDVIHPRQKLEDETYDPTVEETRMKLIQQFARPGGPGAKFKNQLEKMFKAVSLPKGAREELGIAEDGTMPPESDEEEKKEDNEEDDDIDPAKAKEQARLRAERKMNAKLYNQGKWFMIPSFWRLLMYMKKQKREFAVVFNSFGTDMDDVIYEFNKFCIGEHPCFNGRNGSPLVKMDGSKNQKDYRIRDPSQQTTLYRTGDSLTETIQVCGTHQRKQSSDYGHINMIDETDDTWVVRDYLQQFQGNLETLKKFGSMTVQSDFHSWKKSGYSNSRAKLLMLDQADYSTQHIFFDDNADEGDDNCIVDVRDVISGEKIPQRKYQDMYVIKVHPHRAILEPEYFIKKYEDAQEQRDDEIQRVEAGIEEEPHTEKAALSLESIDPASETEWEKIQKMNDADYLMRTVLPVLYQGMRVVDLERPSAPLEYLSLYLLKHQDQVKLPPKAYSVKPDDDKNQYLSK